MAKNKAETVEKIVEMLRSDTYTIAEICRAVGIVSNTYHNWRRDDEEFAKEREKKIKLYEKLLLYWYQKMLV